MRILNPEALRYLPANVEARISASTAFGAKLPILNSTFRGNFSQAVRH